LRAIADKQSFNVNRLVELVKENESILAQMKVRHPPSAIDVAFWLISNQLIILICLECDRLTYDREFARI
jgi:hypothetical protein